MDEESAIYEHHLRERDGIPNKGWVRTMHYSLIQQLIKQDLEHWAL